MAETTALNIPEKKTMIREQAHANRKSQPDKDAVSQRITDRVFSLPEYQNAATVLWYVDVREEVRTRHAFPQALASGKRTLVPYCVDGQLELFHLEAMDELELGAYRILEPKATLRGLTQKKVPVTEVDLILVPGVAFDRSGGRLGHGKGYYDKLLEHARRDTPLVALAFECQLFEQIPMQAHDIFMNKVVTESAVYPGRGR